MILRKEALIVAILLISLMVISFASGWLGGKEATMNWAIEEQIKIEERHLETTQEFVENYNELYADFNELYKKYVELKDLSSGYEIYTVTAYSLNDPAQGTGSICAMGLDLEAYDNLPVVAVDPEVIPLGSIVEIEGLGGFVAADIGGLVTGKHIDVLMGSKEEAQSFGIQKLKVRVIK